MNSTPSACPRPSVIPLAVGLAALIASTATADIIIHDDFDDGALDPAWEITLEDAHGWTFAESGTNLTVTDIDPVVVNPGGGGTWAVVRLARACPSLADFHVDFDISWDCMDTDAAMQRVWVSLIDGDGQAVISAGLSDPWIGSRPCRLALIGPDDHCQFDDLPFAGAAPVDIDRTNGDVTVLFDNDPILNSSLATPIEGVEISFGFYAREGSTDSVFGSESVDLVAIEGTPIAVETQNWGTIKALFR